MKKKIEVKTLYGQYIVVLEPEPDMGGYMITVPNRSDVISWGKNIAHAKKMAKEAIELSVEGQVLVAAEKVGEIVFRKQHVLA
ncbi:MAG: type II toxin-antitoxin system HicB family antitoxin [Patescibacteria group bacterium]